jgi:hypothetical protein
MIGVDHHFVAWQMRWQGAVIAHRALGARFGLPLAGGLGSVMRRLMLGKRLFLILQTELQLIRRQLLGPAAELVARQALNQQAQLVVLGKQILQHLLQQCRIIRQSLTWHAAMMNDCFASKRELIALNKQIIRPALAAAAAPALATRIRQATPPVAPMSARSGPSSASMARRTDRAPAVYSACKAPHRHARLA